MGQRFSHVKRQPLYQGDRGHITIHPERKKDLEEMYRRDAQSRNRRMW
jgi:hypothetical protein